MGFRRMMLPVSPARGTHLTADMVGIGMLFGGAGTHNPNIEDTLFSACEVGMLDDDFRSLSVLVTWLDVHSRWVMADRLVEVATLSKEPRVRAFWAAFGTWKQKDRRFSRLRGLHTGQAIDLLPTGTEFQLRRHGEDPRFAGTALRVDAKILRDRSQDVLKPAELAKCHPTYRWRMVIGPTYRADIWASLEMNPMLSPTELARRAYSSIAPAWEAKRDFEQLRL